MSSVVPLKSITELCEGEENKGGNEELWETVLGASKPGDSILARPICGGNAVLRLSALQQPCLLLTPPALLFGVAPTL